MAIRDESLGSAWPPGTPENQFGTIADARLLSERIALARAQEEYERSERFTDIPDLGPTRMSCGWCGFTVKTFARRECSQLFEAHVKTYHPERTPVP